MKQHTPEAACWAVKQYRPEHRCHSETTQTGAQVSQSGTAEAGTMTMVLVGLAGVGVGGAVGGGNRPWSRPSLYRGRDQRDREREE